MREWLSGGAPPCQGGGRGFDPRLALFLCGCRPAPTCTQSIYCIGYNAFSNKFCVSSVVSGL